MPVKRFLAEDEKLTAENTRPVKVCGTHKPERPRFVKALGEWACSAYGCQRLLGVERVTPDVPSVVQDSFSPQQIIF